MGCASGRRDAASTWKEIFDVHKALFSRKSGEIVRTRSDRIFDAINTCVMVLAALAVIYPLYYCLILSLNDGQDTIRGGITLWPRVFTLDNYKEVFKEGTIVRAFGISVARTVIGTICSLAFNALLSYGLVKKDLMCRKLYMNLCIITMFFSGGTIPLYIMIYKMGLINNFLVYILPGLSGFSTILLYMAFFREIPASLIESAKIDGAHEYQIFGRVVLPLSAPLLATMALFAGVGQWNAWYDGYIYMSNDDLMTMSTYLVKLLNAAAADDLLRRTGRAGVSGDIGGVTSDSLKLATMFVSVLPIACVYPFLQKYFVKGIMIGAVKG